MIHIESENELKEIGGTIDELGVNASLLIASVVKGLELENETELIPIWIETVLRTVLGTFVEDHIVELIKDGIEQAARPELDRYRELAKRSEIEKENVVTADGRITS